jgi:PIN domain nuclease of toxin-antitoxin system
MLLADTMIVTWYVLSPDKLSQKVASQLAAEVAASRPVAVSAYSILELVYMREKKTNGITESEYEAVIRAMRDTKGPFVIVPLDIDVAELVATVPRKFKGLDGAAVENADPGDRVVAATAVKHGLTVVTTDPKIHALVGIVSGLTVLT